MIGLMTDAITGEPKAIHRTAITRRAERSTRRCWGLPAVASSGCGLTRQSPHGLVLGEGIETTLAAATRLEPQGNSLIPAWAACSAGTMAKFPVLPGIEVLTLLVDHDKSEAGQRAAMECAGRWTMADREVIRSFRRSR